MRLDPAGDDAGRPPAACWRVLAAIWAGMIVLDLLALPAFTVASFSGLSVPMWGAEAPYSAAIGVVAAPFSLLALRRVWRKRGRPAG